MKIKSDKARLILCARISIEITRHYLSLGIMRCHSLFTFKSLRFYKHEVNSTNHTSLCQTGISIAGSITWIDITLSEKLEICILEPRQSQIVYAMPHEVQDPGHGIAL